MNWGFIAYGVLAPKIVASLKTVPNQVLYGIASKSKHEQLREEYPHAKVYADYSDLMQDPGVDIIYISTTHNFHLANTIEALENGKHVLCEKPMGLSYKETKKMIDLARAKKLYLMEGMWMRFLPGYRYVKDIWESGKIGKVRMVRAEFSFFNNWSADRRLLNPALAGGSVYDVGVYPMALVNDIFGVLPEKVTAFGEFYETGVDIRCGFMFQYPNRAIAQLYCGSRLETIKEAVIYGDKGWIKMDLFWKCQRGEVCMDGEIKPFDIPYQSTGYAHEIQAVADDIQAGRIENAIFSHEESLRSAELVDWVLGEVGRS